MDVYDPTIWDERYRHDMAAYGNEPSLYLVEKAELAGAGRDALVPADGQGRNGLWLARRGVHVLSIDLSSVGLSHIAETANRENLPLKTLQADVSLWTWPKHAYDLVVSVYFHLKPGDRANVHRSMYASLKPGGHILLEGFHTDQLGKASGGPKDPEMLFTEERLRGDFSEGKIVEFRREDIDLSEGRLHRGTGSLVRMLVRKPA